MNPTTENAEQVTKPAKSGQSTSGFATKFWELIIPRKNSTTRRGFLLLQILHGLSISSTRRSNWRLILAWALISIVNMLVLIAYRLKPDLILFIVRAPLSRDYNRLSSKDSENTVLWRTYSGTSILPIHEKRTRLSPTLFKDVGLGLFPTLVFVPYTTSVMNVTSQFERHTFKVILTLCLTCIVVRQLWVFLTAPRMTKLQRVSAWIWVLIIFLLACAVCIL